ncbi:MAG: hypothetical protein QM765_47065 [Myxococcales bacterium]
MRLGIKGWVGLGALAASLGGCAGPEHLGSGTTGAATRAVATLQAVRPPSKVAAKAATGLDSQEAAIISEAYRRSLAPKGAAVDEPSVLFVAPNSAKAQGRALPPPSVPPKER